MTRKNSEKYTCKPLLDTPFLHVFWPETVIYICFNRNQGEQAMDQSSLEIIDQIPQWHI